jgi:hypothetical protein
MSALRFGVCVAVLLATASARADDAPESPPTEPAPSQAPAEGDGPQPPATAPAPVAEARPRPPPKTTWAVLRFDGGYATRTLHEIPMEGGVAAAGVGIDRKWIGVYASLQAMFASTEHGLGARSWRPACELDVILDRVRLGPGLGLLFFSLDRAVRDATLDGRGMTFFAAARVDVLRPSGYTIFARGAMDYTFLTTGVDTAMWGPSIGLGVDFDLGSQPRHPDEP